MRAARVEFAAHGPDGGRVNRIAAEAGVNKERIYGYFGSKEHLFEIVVATALEEMVAAIPLNPGDDLAGHVLQTMEFHQRQPDLLRLLMWEALHYGDAQPPYSARRCELYNRKVASLATLLGSEADHRTALTLFAMTGLAAWTTAMPQLGAAIAGKTITDDTSRATLRELSSRMVASLM